MGALATIQEGNKCSEKTKAKAVVFLHQHINEMVEFEYSNWDDPSTLWKDLEIRFNNQREVLLLSTRDEWNNLRFQDFKKVNEYTSALFRICRILRFCGQTVTEGDIRPTGSLTLPKANFVNNIDNKNSESKRGRGGYNGRGRGRGRGRSQRNNTYHAPQVNNFNQKNNEVGTSQNHEGSCFRCRSANHWSKSCRTPSHLCELYQASRKGKEKEVNHMDQFDNTNTELIASDFFNDLEV
ncbi:hypothetical protein Tco_0526472 [Tanacetum coccineum]